MSTWRASWAVTTADGARHAAKTMKALRNLMKSLPTRGLLRPYVHDRRPSPPTLLNSRARKAFCTDVASRQTWRSQARFEAHRGRFARGRHLSVAGGPDRPALPGGRGAGPADRGQGHQRLRPGALQV